METGEWRIEQIRGKRGQHWTEEHLNSVEVKPNLTTFASMKLMHYLPGEPIWPETRHFFHWEEQTADWWAKSRGYTGRGARRNEVSSVLWISEAFEVAYVNAVYALVSSSSLTYFNTHTIGLELAETCSNQSTDVNHRTFRSSEETWNKAEFCESVSFLPELTAKAQDMNFAKRVLTL